MSGKATVVYWDSSAFIALLKEERTHGDGVYDALLSQAGAFDRNQIVLATSTIGIAEVLSMPLADGARERFESMIQRSNFQTNPPKLSSPATGLERDRPASSIQPSILAEIA